MSTLPGVSLHRSHSVSTDQYSYLPPLERSIVTFMLNQPSSEDGIHVGAIARAVGGSAASIRYAILLACLLRYLIRGSLLQCCT